MTKTKQGMFRGRTSRSMEKPKSNFGYLLIPENINVFKPEGGTGVIFDILPYRVTDPQHIDNKKYADDAVVGELWWKRPVRVHRDVGQDALTIICPTTVGKKCPICEYGNQRRKAGADWDELKEIFPKSRTIFLINLLDAGDCEVDYTEGEVHILDMSDHLFMEILAEESGKDIDNENFPDPYDGLSIEVYFRSKKLGKNKYAEASKIDFIGREEQYDEEYVNALPCLDDMLKILSYKEIEALYLDGEPLEDEDIDPEEIEEEEPPKRQSRRTSHTASSRRTKPTHKPKEEPEEEEEEEEEEPEEAPPSRRRKPPIHKPVKEEPEEEDESEEEEDVKRPPRRTAKVSHGSTKNKCPYGHVFGKDTDEFDDCDKCKIWDDCSEAKESR